ARTAIGQLVVDAPPTSANRDASARREGFLAGHAGIRAGPLVSPVGSTLLKSDRRPNRLGIAPDRHSHAARARTPGKESGHPDSEHDGDQSEADREAQVSSSV